MQLKLMPRLARPDDADAAALWYEGQRVSGAAGSTFHKLVRLMFKLMIRMAFDRR